MKLSSLAGSGRAYMLRAMAGSTRVPAAVVVLVASACLVVIVLLDGQARHAGIRLVPLYAPLFCITTWVLGRWYAILFAIVAAAPAILPDALASPMPFGFATVANAAVRILSYIFLASIIVCYRRTFDEADLRAMYDGLTGVMNKMSLHAMAAKQLLGAQRGRQFIVFAYVDLDGFKAVNTLTVTPPEMPRSGLLRRKPRPPSGALTWLAGWAAMSSASS